MQKVLEYVRENLFLFPSGISLHQHLIHLKATTQLVLTL